MTFSRGKMLVSLVDNKIKSYMNDKTTVTNPETCVSSLNTAKFIVDDLLNFKEDQHTLEDSKKSSSTVNSTEDINLDLPELENPQKNTLPSEEKCEENLNTSNVNGHLVSSTEIVLLATNKEDDHRSVVEAEKPEESLLIEESHTQVPQWKLLEPTAGGTKLRFKRFSEKRSKPVDWSSDSDIIDDTDSDPDFDIKNEYNRNRPKRSLLFNLKRFEKNRSKRHQNKKVHIDQPSCSTWSDDHLLPNDCTENFAAAQQTNVPNDNDEAVDIEVQPIPSKTKKQKAQPSKWRKAEAKLLRNTGKQYTSSSKSKKEIPAKCVKPPCGESCRLKCYENINQDQRTKIFSQFWSLGDITRQREFVSRSITSIQPKYRYANPEKVRRLNNAFYFNTEGGRIRVCKTFFLSTLDIPYRFIRTVVEKVDKGFLEEDLRGKHGKHKTVEPERKETAREHIKSIPRIESHYLRKQTKREFIEGGKSVADLYRDYKQECIEKNKLYCSPSMYSNIFNYEFNISPFQPKKDQCDFCTSFNLANEEEKLKLKESYDLHLKEKDLSRDSKEEDKKKAGETYIVACYDLQAVFPVPKGEVSSFYYKSKLNCLNFTICELKKNEVYCYAWHEGEGGRGVNELGTCVYKFIKEKSEAANDDNLEFVFYSDNCGGQQKNKFMITMYVHAVSVLKIKSITHKYLIKGHTQNEGDTAHSVIEKATKKALKSGPVYVPEQYFAIIRNAKKTGSAFKVNEMCHRDFYDFKKVYTDCGFTNPQPKKVKKKSAEDNTEGQDSEELQYFKMTKAHIIRVEKKDPTCILYKNYYSDKEYNKEILKVKRRNNRSLQDVVLSQAYCSKLKVGERKKSDILSLIEANLIPQYYKDFYLNL